MRCDLEALASQIAEWLDDYESTRTFTPGCRDWAFTGANVTQRRPSASSWSIATTRDPPSRGMANFVGLFKWLD
jgi:hypothetical protein